MHDILTEAVDVDDIGVMNIVEALTVSSIVRLRDPRSVFGFFRRGGCQASLPRIVFFPWVPLCTRPSVPSCEEVAALVRSP